MKKKISGICLALILVFTSLNSVQAESGWQKIGTWKMSDVIVFKSTDGGDVKACVPGTAKITFKLTKNYPAWPGPNQTTSGVYLNNCAIWKDAVTAGNYYRLYLEAPRPATVTVTVYD